MLDCDILEDWQNQLVISADASSPTRDYLHRTSSSQIMTPYVDELGLSDFDFSQSLMDPDDCTGSAVSEQPQPHRRASYVNSRTASTASSSVSTNLVLNNLVENSAQLAPLDANLFTGFSGGGGNHVTTSGLHQQHYSYGSNFNDGGGSISIGNTIYKIVATSGEDQSVYHSEAGNILPQLAGPSGTTSSLAHHLPQQPNDTIFHQGQSLHARSYSTTSNSMNEFNGLEYLFNSPSRVSRLPRLSRDNQCANALSILKSMTGDDQAVAGSSSSAVSNDREAALNTPPPLDAFSEYSNYQFGSLMPQQSNIYPLPNTIKTEHEDLITLYRDESAGSSGPVLESNASAFQNFQQQTLAPPSQLQYYYQPDEAFQSFESTPTGIPPQQDLLQQSLAANQMPSGDQLYFIQYNDQTLQPMGQFVNSNGTVVFPGQLTAVAPNYDVNFLQQQTLANHHLSQPLQLDPRLQLQQPQSQPSRQVHYRSAASNTNLPKRSSTRAAASRKSNVLATLSTNQADADGQSGGGLRVSGRFTATGEKIRRPPNAFMIFAKEHRRRILYDDRSKTNKDVSKVLGNMWRQLPAEKRQEYQEQSETLRHEHQNKYPGYYYSPLEARRMKEERKLNRLAKQQEAKEAKEEEARLISLVNMD